MVQIVDILPYSREEIRQMNFDGWVLMANKSQEIHQKRKDAASKQP